MLNNKVMKKSILIVLSCCFLLSNCSVNNSTSSSPQNVKYFWHLINVTGGIAGVDWEFNVNTIVWDFDADAGTLTVENNNTDDNIEDGLDSGIYEYYEISTDNVTYLVVDDIELGSLEIVNNQLKINQNEMTTGTVSDGYIYTFQVEIITVD